MFKTKLKKLLILGIFGVCEFSLARFSLAELENPLASETFADLIANVAEIVAEVGLPVAVIAIIYAGFLFATARGNEEQIKTAKKTFFWAIIGTALILGAWAISIAIEEFLLSLQ